MLELYFLYIHLEGGGRRNVYLFIFHPHIELSCLTAVNSKLVMNFKQDT